MKYWWVNQKQTFKEEVGGGYMWSPKTNVNGAKNTFYSNMSKVKEGDCIFSYYFGEIQNIGIAMSQGISSPKPIEFGEKGERWNTEGWLVKVFYQKLTPGIIIKEIITELQPHIPEKYSPISQEGKGMERYLCSVPNNMAEVLIKNLPNKQDLLYLSSRLSKKYS